MRYLAALLGAIFLLSGLPILAGAPKHSQPKQFQSGHFQTGRLPAPMAPPRASIRPSIPIAASNQPDRAAEDLLKQMLQAENSLAIAGDQVTTVSQNGLDLTSEQQVQRDGARSLRLEYQRPARLAGEQIIDNGRFYCHLIPAKDTLELSPSRIQSLRVRVPEVIGQIRSGHLLVQSAGQGSIAGHSCGIVQVAARSSSPVPWHRFWIDPTNGAQLRIEQYDAAGHLQSASYYTAITYSPHFDAGTFRLPEAGSKVVTSGFATPSLTLDQVRVEAGFPVPTPTYLPGGFTFQAGSVSAGRVGRVIELRYSNGANVLVLFETSDSATAGPSQTQHPRHGVLFGRQAGMKVVIIANVANGELEKVLLSLH
jgi:hypothetical protein